MTFWFPRWLLGGGGALGLLLAMPLTPVHATDTTPEIREATPQEIAEAFRERKRFVVTFLGYSGAGYEDPEAMLRQAAAVLETHDPSRTVVNIGATAEGIGAVYELARKKGFPTTGIVSTQARDQQVALSPAVQQVYYVKDATWGGFLPGTRTLSPASTAMVAVSDLLVAIGGGDVARDELQAARDAGKRVRIFAADMNHRIATEKAQKKGLAAPADFRGPVSVLAESQSPIAP